MALQTHATFRYSAKQILLYWSWSKMSLNPVEATGKWIKLLYSISVLHVWLLILFPSILGLSKESRDKSLLSSPLIPVRYSLFLPPIILPSPLSSRSCQSSESSACLLRSLIPPPLHLRAFLSSCPVLYQCMSCPRRTSESSLPPLSWLADWSGLFVPLEVHLLVGIEGSFLPVNS